MHTFFHLLILKFDSADHVRLTAVPVDFLFEFCRELFNGGTSFSTLPLNQTFNFFAQFGVLLDERAFGLQLPPQFHEGAVSGKIHIDFRIPSPPHGLPAKLAADPIVTGKFISVVEAFDDLLILKGLADLFDFLFPYRTERIQFRFLMKQLHSNFIYHSLILQMKNNLQRLQKVDLCVDEGEGRTYEILGLIDQLFQMRLVDKLSRPISFEAKEVVFQGYKQKFMLLHQLLERTRKEVPRENESTQSKNKSFNSNVGIKQKTQKQDIKKIQARYNEVFIEGSFKFYYKVAKLYGLPTNLIPVNIEQWANQCLEEEKEKGCC